jgi:hypothetical protein
LEVEPKIKDRRKMGRRKLGLPKEIENDIN